MQFWKDKKVLVTGSTGFKGSWLSVWLKHYGADLVGYSLPIKYTPSIYSACKLNNYIPTVFADIKDYSTLKSVITKNEPEIIFHLAAQPLVSEGYQDPLDTFAVNVQGTANVLEAARHIKSVKAVIIVTTDKCYENLKSHEGYIETDRLGGLDPYSCSKACAELVTNSYYKSFLNNKPAYEGSAAAQIGIASVRAGNVIGGGDWSDNRIIPDIVRAITNGSSLTLRNPGFIRPWQHVLEPLSGYMLLAEKLYYEPARYSGAWNFGPDKTSEENVGFVVEKFLKHWGSDIKIVQPSGHMMKESQVLRLNSSKAEQELNWKPKMDLVSAIEITADWYRAFLADTDNMLELTMQQIQNYANRN